MSIPPHINPSRIPQHVAVIMDGNGRWAKQKGEMRIVGHMSGVESVRESLTAARELGVKYLTLYAFSTENWNRPKEEVDALMDLLVNTIANEIESLHENGVRLRAIGNLNNLPDSCRKALEKAIEQTANNSTIQLVLALSYSSRWELTDAVKKIRKNSDCRHLRKTNHRSSHHPRYSRSRTIDPHQRRMQDQQLSPLAMCLHRILFYPHFLA
jgi:undecaprenyl diphosphate synthase